MTLKIEIYGTPDHGPLADQINEAMAAIGFVQSRGDGYKVGPVDTGSLTAAGERIAETRQTGVSGQTSDAPVRERGKPAPGRARRTKEEIAEDEAADAAGGSSVETALAVQTGGERVNPEEAAQDAADEAAEDDGNAGPAPTADDVKNAMMGYVNAHGMAEAQEDGPALLLDTLGKPPAGETFWKLSLIPEEKYGAVIAAWKAAAAAGKRYQRRGA